MMAAPFTAPFHALPRTHAPRGGSATNVTSFFFPFPLDNFLVSTDTRKGRISRYPNRIHTRLDTPQGCCFTCYAALLDTHQEHTQSHAIEFESEMDTRTQGSVAKKCLLFFFFYWRRRKKDVGFVACVCVCVENVST